MMFMFRLSYQFFLLQLLSYNVSKSRLSSYNILCVTLLKSVRVVVFILVVLICRSWTAEFVVIHTPAFALLLLSLLMNVSTPPVTIFVTHSLFQSVSKRTIHFLIWQNLMIPSTFSPYLVLLIWQKVHRRCTLLFQNSFILRVGFEHYKVFLYLLNFVSSKTALPKLGQREQYVLAEILKFAEQLKLIMSFEIIMNRFCKSVALSLWNNFRFLPTQGSTFKNRYSTCESYIPSKGMQIFGISLCCIWRILLKYLLLVLSHPCGVEDD